MLRLENINKVINNAHQSLQVLSNINFTVNPGEIYGLVGRSGAGKSTLLRCINLLTRPTNGLVFIDECEITSLSHKELRHQRQRIGMIFQHFNLLESRTVYENIVLPLEIIGLKNQIKKRVPELIDLVGLTQKQNNYPHQLSGGQKQRVAIARALAMQPAILLCDEATSSLDSEVTQSILNLLKTINRELNLTIFLVSHELNVVKSICHRVGVLDHGSLIEEANTADIFLKPQHSITKQLVLPILNIDRQRKHNTYLLKLIFMGKESEEPIISSLIKTFSIDINILQAEIECIQDARMGYTICEFVGEKERLHQALHYLTTTNISVEVINEPV